MSHLDNQQFDSLAKNIPQKKSQNTLSLLDYVGDSGRDEPLVGLQYVVEIKMLETDKSVIKCNLCGVKGHMATMKEHLVGTNHINVYMEKHYFSVLQSLKRSSHHKVHFGKLLKDYAKEIERAEGTQSLKIEYVSAADMKKEQENWIAEQEENLDSHAEQRKFHVSDKRQMALNYSEKFKISSREEATIVLNLTQQLSDQLEQYFLKYKGLDILDSTKSSAKPTTAAATTNVHPTVHENLHRKGAENQGLVSVSKEMQWHIQEPSSSSMCTPTSVPSFDRMPAKLQDTRGLKRKQEVPEYASVERHVHPEHCSTSEFQNIQKRPHKEPDNLPTMHSSSFSYMNDMRYRQHSLAEVSSSHSFSMTAPYTHNSIPKEQYWVPESFGGEMQMVRDTPQNSISQNCLNDNVSKTEAVHEIKSQNYTDAAETSGLGAENSSVPGLSSSTSNCPDEPRSEKPSSRTSKTLSPDILHLLKGKDANTVANILRTLSPFYPALQEVNIEMLSKVLVNTGALD